MSWRVLSLTDSSFETIASRTARASTETPPTATGAEGTSLRASASFFSVSSSFSRYACKRPSSSSLPESNGSRSAFASASASMTR